MKFWQVKGSLLSKVLLRVLPATTVIMLAIGYQAQKFVESSFLDQIESSLEKDAQFSAETIASRLKTIRNSIENIAANTLVINALVDTGARANYLPLFFNHLQIAEFGRDIDIRYTDYRGRLIASNGARTGFTGERWHDLVIENNEPRLHFDEASAQFAFPVMYQGNAEGVIFVEATRPQISEALSITLGERAVIIRKAQIELFTTDSELKNSSEPDKWEAEGWIVATATVPNYPDILVTVAAQSRSVMAPLTDLSTSLFLVLALALIALAGGIWSTAYLTTQPLAEYTNKLKKYGAAPDLLFRLADHTTNEFQDLTSSFNEMMNRLRKTLVSNEHLVEENKIRLRAEEQVRDKEARTRAILDTVLDGIITIDSDGIIETFNPASATIFGYQPEEVIGRNVFMLMPEPYRSGHDGYLRHHFATGETKVIGIGREVQGQRKDGTVFPMELAVNPMMVGGMKMFTGVVRDISERKTAEQLIEATRNRLVDAIESLPDGFALYDSDDRLVICNTKYRTLYNLPIDLTSPGTPFNDILSDGLSNGVYADAIGREEEWFEERHKKHRNYSGVLEQRLSNGIWLRVVEQQTSDGGAVGIRVDITEQKRREALLAASESRMRATISAALDCVIILDAVGRVTEFNPAAVETFGYSRSDALGQTMGDTLISEQFRPVFKNIMTTYVSTGISNELDQRIEVEGMKSNGEIFPIELTLSSTEGLEEIGFVAFIRDLTERKRIDRLKDEFVSVVSHELRTPLTSLTGSLQLVTWGVLGEIPDKAKSMLEIACRNTERLTLLVNDILDVEKIQSGQMSFMLVPVDVIEMARSAVEENLAYGEKYDVNIRLECDAENAYANIDRDRIVQVLANLLSNAVKFSAPKSEVVLRISRQNGMIQFAVIDHGAGIPKDRLPLLFERFYQVDASDRRSKQGTGLGLTIVKSIIEEHGSQIEVESEKDKGSTFHFSLVELETITPGQAEAGPLQISDSKRPVTAGP